MLVHLVSGGGGPPAWLQQPLYEQASFWGGSGDLKAHTSQGLCAHRLSYCCD